MRYRKSCVIAVLGASSDASRALLQGKYFASQSVPASFAKVNYWGVHAFASRRSSVPTLLAERTCRINC